MGPRCQPPRTRNMWYLDYFAHNKQCISLWAVANGKNKSLLLNKQTYMLNLLVFVFAKHRTFLFWSGLKLY
jgi:hypothetical protein